MKTCLVLFLLPRNQRCRWTRYYCSTFFLFYFFCLHTRLFKVVRMDLYCGPRERKNVSARGSNTQRTFLKDWIPVLYSIFIYLLTWANLYSYQEGLTLSVLFLCFNFTLDIHTAGCSCRCTKLPSRMAKGLIDSYAVLLEEPVVECLNQGHFYTIWRGVVAKLLFEDAKGLCVCFIFCFCGGMQRVLLASKGHGAHCYICFTNMTW